MITRYVDSLNSALHEMMSKDDRVLLIGEDVLDPYGGAFKVSRGLSSAFPNQVISTPISEQAITGAAIGLAMHGKLPVAEIMFGDFIALCVDQIVNHASKFSWIYNDQVKVPLVIRTPMGGRRGYGATHSQSLEAMFMGVPFLSIVAPSHFHNPGELLKQVVMNEQDPVLFVENKSLYSNRLLSLDHKENGGLYGRIVTQHNSAYPTISLAMVPDEMPDVTLISYGGMAPIVCEAAQKVFMEEEIIVEVLLPSLLKPVPVSDFFGSVSRSGNVLVAEEGVITGGWGAEVSALVHYCESNFLKSPIKRIGSKELPIPSARDLEAATLPSVDDVVKELLSF
jgi:pyruvate/2-oxoglutarate/acetoin dehydrogenase E1 component